MLHYRLGLDVGTNSLGWCALHIRKDGSPVGMLDWGVRIFDDGREPAKKDIPGESSAVQRRMARGMRRRYDRKLIRKKATLRELIKAGLMPENSEARKKLEALEPLKLRNDALIRKLEPYEIGRALFHLQQRRGFKSNRKESRSNNESITPMKEAALSLEQLLIGKTLGQFLYTRNQQRQSTRFHSRQEGSKTVYDYYPTRKLVEEEFHAIWEAQRRYHSDLMTEEAKEAIRKAIFHQRKLKPQPKGNCAIIPTEERMAWAMPTAQHFRIAKEIANLCIRRPDDYLYKGVELEARQKLSQEQRQKLFDALCEQPSLTFKKIKDKKCLNLDSTITFNLESEHRDRLDGDKTAAIMRGGKKGERFPGWDALKIEEQDAIVSKLLCDDEDDPDYMEDEALTQWLIERYRLTPEQAENVVNAPLPSGYAKFGKTVISETLPKMRDEGMMEYAALVDCGRNPGDQFTGEILEKLPYYGELLEGHVVKNGKSSDPMVREHGRVGNPTVHIALNQIRRLMNVLKDRYGFWPQEIVIEMARDLKKGRSEVAEIIKAIDKNTKQRDAWRGEIAEYLEIEEAAVSDYDLAKMKLWCELEGDATHRKCVFSGEMISVRDLLSDRIEIEHILPKSQTLDNTAANKTLATREANRIKANRMPYEAFKNESGEFAYAKVYERAQTLPNSKRWRFLPDAMDKFVAKGDFAARQLNDTSYIARLAKKYLAYACMQGEKGVQASPGTLTGLLRKAWGLNALLGEEEAKNRNDHRHHAVDALVIAMTTRSMVKSVADAARKEEAEKGVRLVSHIPKPWPDFSWAGLKQRLDEIVVSHKPDHGSPRQSNANTPKTWGTSGRLHEDTYYGYIGEGEKKGTVKLVVRVPLQSLKSAGELADIRDKELREALQRFIYEHGGKFEDALKAFSESDKHQWGGIRNVRVLAEKSRDSMIPIKKREDGKPWKMAQGGSNQRAEIYCLKSGEKAGKWQIEIIKSFDANQSGFIPSWRQEHPDAELMMTLHMNDMVAYEDAGKTHIVRVQKINANGQVFFVPQTIVKPDKETSFSFRIGPMQQRKFRRVYVEIDGGVYDPRGIVTKQPVFPEAVA